MVWAVTAPRARASRREILLDAASRSFLAAVSRSEARRVIAATRSSSVRSFNRASTSIARDVATRERSDSSAAVSGSFASSLLLNFASAIPSSRRSVSIEIEASTITAFNLSISANALFTPCPAAAICSAIPAILASDSFNFANATSKLACRVLRFSSERDNSNFKRSVKWEQLVKSDSASEIIALISIKEFLTVEPPRALDCETISPSRVIAVTEALAATISSASASESAAT